jgi:hypothetical protein
MEPFNLKYYLSNNILLQENKSEDYLNQILDKILSDGLDSLSPEEKQYLDNVSQGTDNKTPDEFLQDLFKSWKVGEIEAGNDIENIYDWEDLHKFDQDYKDGFLKYVDLVKKYPSLDKEDLALLNSIGHIKYISGSPAYMPYSQYEWDSLDEKTYNKILSKEYNIEPQEEYDPDELSYEEEFGFSFEDKEEMEKIKKHIKSIYKDFDKVKKESIKLFQKSTGRNPSKELISFIFNDYDVKEYQNPPQDEQIKILKSLGFKGDNTNQIFQYDLPNNQEYWIVPETFYYAIEDDYGKTIKRFDNFKEMVDYFKSQQQK